MSEATVHAGIQAVLQGIAAFADADVVINQWGVLDQSNENAPYAIISTSDEFSSRQDVVTPETTWQVPVTLVEAFTDWPTTLNNLRTRRQAIIDEFNAVGAARSANGLAATTVDLIRNEGPITPRYDPYLREEELAEALPQFLIQTLILVTTEY